MVVVDYTGVEQCTYVDNMKKGEGSRTIDMMLIKGLANGLTSIAMLVNTSVSNGFAYWNLQIESLSTR